MIDEPAPRGLIEYRPRSEGTRRIILMDTHTGPEVRNLEAVLRSGGRVLGLLDIGYHFLIDRDGLIQETRPRHTVGAHTPGYNHDSIGVALAGGVDPLGTPADNFTQLQLYALDDLLLELRTEYGWLPLVGKTELKRYRGRSVANPCIDMEWLRKEALSHPTKDRFMSDVSKITETSQSVVLKYLQEGRTLTQQVALACLGVGSLTSRIAELRKQGYEIDGIWRTDRFNRRYKAYKLVSEGDSEHAPSAPFEEIEQ